MLVIKCWPKLIFGLDPLVAKVSHQKVYSKFEVCLCETERQHFQRVFVTDVLRAFADSTSWIHWYRMLLRQSNPFPPIQTTLP